MGSRDGHGLRAEGRRGKLLERLERSLEDFRAAKKSHQERLEEQKRGDAVRAYKAEGLDYLGDLDDLLGPTDWFSDGADYSYLSPKEREAKEALQHKEEGPPRAFVPGDVDWYDFLVRQQWCDEAVLNRQRAEWVYRCYQVYLFEAEAGLLHQGLF